MRRGMATGLGQAVVNHRQRAKKARRTRTLALDSLNMLHATTIESTNNGNFNSSTYNDPNMSDFVSMYQEEMINASDLANSIKKYESTGEDVIGTGVQLSAMFHMKMEAADEVSS